MTPGNTEGTRIGDSVETAREALPQPHRSDVCPVTVAGEDTVRSASMAKMQRAAEMTALRWGIPNVVTA